MPHIVSVRPLSLGGENADFDSVLRTIAGTIRDTVSRQVMRFTGWSNYRSLNEAYGRLLATNENEGTVHGFTQNFASVGEITHQAITEVFESIQQSNGSILITDIIWEFHIDPNSIAVGGAQKVRVPSWAPAVKYRKTWEGHDGVNCAAYALCYLMYGEREVLQKAEELQEELGWQDTVVIQDLQKFIDVYPTFRLSIFLPHCATTPFTFTGKDFVWPNPMPRQCPEKLLYLVYDPTQKHFAATKSPGQILTAIKKSNTRWCHKCVVGFSQIQPHVCADGEIVQERKKHKPMPCLKCGVIGTHSCSLVSCRFCSSIYKKEEGYDHRCIVYKEEKKEKEKIFYSKGPLDGSLTCLWVYDFESRIAIEDSVRQVISDFNVNENGHYLQEEEVRVLDFKIQKHEVNFVAFRNVFTDEEKTFFGPQALTDFILFMLSHNKGKNICIAHNASGYDTRLLFSQCKILDQTVAMNPIMRGGKFMQLTLNKVYFLLVFSHLFVDYYFSRFPATCSWQFKIVGKRFLSWAFEKRIFSASV